MTLTKEELIAFETEIKEIFEAGKIRAPVHLSGGNEEQLIRIFQEVKPDDWVFSTHRSHYHALLKGIPPEWVKSEILAGRSICLHNTEYKFWSSAIVGGAVPQAVGVAMTGENVWCFVGDMAAETGIFHESVKYSEHNDLPITFVIEDNGVSVDTPTIEVWGNWLHPSKKIRRYAYKPQYPHQGSGKWIQF